jgi:hypothetical protein
MQSLLLPKQLTRLVSQIEILFNLSSPYFIQIVLMIDPVLHYLMLHTAIGHSSAI